MAFRLAEVEATSELSYDDHVDAVQVLGFEGCCVPELRVDLDGADIGEEVELLAEGEQALLGADRGLGVVPLGPANCAK